MQTPCAICVNPLGQWIRRVRGPFRRSLRGTHCPGAFTVEVRNETHDVANFAIAELAEGAKIEEIEPWYGDARRKLGQPGPYNFNPPQLKTGPFSSSLVAAGTTGELPVNESSGSYVVLCALDAGSWGAGGWGLRLFAATELNVQPSS
jgi:hypothetical protein